MKPDAIAIANYVIDKANNGGGMKPLTILRLVKFVYIIYGYSLAALGRSVLNPDYDRVEAWKFGPVIPSVYHTFKHNQNNTISEKGIVLNVINGEAVAITPELVDKSVKIIADWVLRTHDRLTTSELIDLLHEKGTPWAYMYSAMKNVVIPEEMTKLYYSDLFEQVRKNAANG